VGDVEDVVDFVAFFDLGGGGGEFDDAFVLELIGFYID